MFDARGRSLEDLVHDDPFSGSLDLDAVTVSQARGVVGTPIPGLEWAQESDTVTLYVALAAGARGRDLAVKITVEALSVTPKRGGPHDRAALGLPDGATMLLSGKLGGRCKPDESEWTIEAGELVITLRKALQREWAHAIDPTGWTRAQHSAPAEMLKGIAQLAEAPYRRHPAPRRHEGVGGRGHFQGRCAARIVARGSSCSRAMKSSV